jgi:hypothetical protein
MPPVCFPAGAAAVKGCRFAGIPLLLVHSAQCHNHVSSDAAGWWRPHFRFFVTSLPVFVTFALPPLPLFGGNAAQNTANMTL